MQIRQTQIGQTSQLVSYMQKTQNDLMNLQNKISSNKNIQNISEDPIAVGQILNLNGQLSKLETYGSNINLGQSQMQINDTTLNQITTTMQRLNDLAVQGSTGTNSAETLQSIKQEVDQLIQSLVGLANTKYEGQYMFSGTNTDTPAYTYDETTGAITYNGTKTINPDGTKIADADSQRKIKIGDGMYVDLNVAGDALFGFYDPDDETNSTGIFNSLSKLSKALGDGDYEGVAAEIDNITNGIDSISSQRAVSGANSQRMTMTQTNIEDTQLLLTSDRSSIQGLDLISAYSDLSNYTYAYQASMQVSTQLMNLSILNYL